MLNMMDNDSAWPKVKRLLFGSVRNSLLQWRLYPSPPNAKRNFSVGCWAKILPSPEAEYWIGLRVTCLPVPLAGQWLYGVYSSPPGPSGWLGLCGPLSFREKGVDR